MAERLSLAMLSVLHGLANPHPDDDPFPPANTLAALARRKLIRFVEIRKPRGTLEALVGRHLQRIEITAAGRTALALAPTPGGLAEGER